MSTADSTFHLFLQWAQCYSLHKWISHWCKALVLKPWPARPSGVAREAIFIGKKA